MELICKGVERRWLHDQRVVMYTVKSLGPSNLIDWSKAVAESLDRWPAQTDYIAIHDLSQTGMSLQYLMLTGYNILDPWLTPNSHIRFQEWMKQYPAQRICLAVVVSSALSGRISMKRGRGSSVDIEQVDSRVFDDLTAAQLWVSGLM